MIFGRMSNFGREFVLLGMNAENVREIQSGKPLVIGPVPGDPALAAMQIIIVCGETDADVMSILKSIKLLDPETSIDDTP